MLIGKSQLAVMNKRVSEIRDMWEVQGMPGNWNHDVYMCGLFNGLEAALAVMEGREPVYRTLK